MAMQSAMFYQQPMTDIKSPHSNDVLCGRGVTTNRHTGNEGFRSLVNCNKVRAIFLIPLRKNTTRSRPHDFQTGHIHLIFMICSSLMYPPG
eukprot:scaffold85724_cov50-Attheya_sp.AAC.4